MPKAAPQVELTQDQVNAIQEWTAAKATLDAAKTDELTRRMVVVNTAPFNADKEEGGQTIKLNGGWALKLDRPMDYKMESKDNDKVVATMGELAAHNPNAIIDLIRWEPVMSVAQYKKLTDTEKKILAPVVTTKPGTPSLALNPPATPKA